METGRDNEDNFKKLIREATPDQPKADFTRIVMQQVREEAALQNILQQHTLEAPSPAFSKNILAQLQPSRPALTFKPVISRKGWYGIAAMLACILVACFFLPDPENKSALAAYLSSAIVPNPNITEKVKSIPQLYPVTLICLAGLLFIDYFLRERWSVLNKPARS